MIGTGVLPKYDDDFCFVKIMKFYRAFAHAQRFAQGHTAAFVTHVAAVGQIIGAILPYKKLVQKSSFVTGAARCIKDGFIGRGEFI